MKAIVMTPNGLKLSDVQKPTPGPDEVLVRIEWASVCGSDYPFLNGVVDNSHLIGKVMGHEGAGQIVEIGNDVKGFHTGEKVAFESHRARKEWLKDGNDAYKDKHFAIIGYRGFPKGKPPQGTWAEYISVPAVYAHKIPNELAYHYPGSLWEPLGNSIRLATAVKERFPDKNKEIVFSGCGPQGMLAMLILNKYYGYKKIIALEVSDKRIELMNKLGIAKVYKPSEMPKISPEMWVEVSGAYPAYKQAIETTKKGGTIILFGLIKKDIEIEGLPYNTFVLDLHETKQDGLNLIGISGRLNEDWVKCPEVIKELAGTVDLNELYSYYGPLQNMPHIEQSIGLPPKDPEFVKAVFSGFLL